MNERLLIASQDSRFCEWLRHFIGTVRSYDRIDMVSLGELLDDGTRPTHRDTAAVLVHTDFLTPPGGPVPSGLELVSRLARLPDRPPLVIIAQDGDELTAVRAMRMGVEDYLPRDLLTPERLGSALRNALRSAEKRAAADNDAESIDIDIPRYQILRTIGRSERATVYLAASDEADTQVALKVTQNPPGEDPNLMQNLSREYEALAAIHDPSVVDIFDYGVHGGCEYLAMEYFPCGDLRSRMSKPLTVAQTVAYIERIARALQVVHQHGVVHRDLKPPNVMLRDNDEVVLIDFGLAKSGEGGNTSYSGMLRGSPYYMSPEQAQGVPVDSRSDLYSLGVIFYEMLTGRKPFYGDTAIEVLQKHVNALVPPLPAELAAFQPVIDRLLAKNPDERYADAEQLTAALTGTG